MNDTATAREPFDFLALDPKKHRLFLDHDGTVAPFVVDPKTAFPPREFVATLERLQKIGFDISLCSGRPIQPPRPGEACLDTFYQPLRLSASGLHGFEFRPTPGAPVQRPVIEPIPPEWWEKAEAIAARYGADIEPKGASNLAIQVRRIADIAGKQAALAAFEAEFIPFLETHTDFRLQPGHQVLELCPDEVKGVTFDKGQSIARFMALPENQGKLPVFFGDDASRLVNGVPTIGTDESGFQKVLDYSVGDRRGMGVLVGAETRNPDCTSVAGYRVETPQDLWAGLGRLAEKWENAAPASGLAANGRAAGRTPMSYSP